MSISRPCLSTVIQVTFLLRANFYFKLVEGTVCHAICMSGVWIGIYFLKHPKLCQLLTIYGLRQFKWTLRWKSLMVLPNQLMTDKKCYQPAFSSKWFVIQPNMSNMLPASINCSQLTTHYGSRIHVYVYHISQPANYFQNIWNRWDVNAPPPPPKSWHEYLRWNN